MIGILDLLGVGHDQAPDEQVIIDMPDDEDPRGIEILPDYAVPIFEYFIPTTRWLYTPKTLETDGAI